MLTSITGCLYVVLPAHKGKSDSHFHKKLLCR